jgi:hypothetical protein
MVIAVLAKGFTDVQQRWSAMERELYALWQGVVGHERLIKGFKCYCYIDHKNNIFSDAQLDNRRRSKKMSNWALELQQFNIERIWIRGEANILADAPSRAPWEETLAQFLPIPDMPVRDLIIKLYQAPGEVEDLVSRRRDALTGDKPWAALAGDSAHLGPCLDQIKGDEFRTPDFGKGTPDFGENVKYVQELMSTFGSGRVLRTFGAEWPRFPMWSLEEPVTEKVRVGDELKRSYLVEPYPFPACGIERRKDPRGFNYIVRWPDKLRF